MVSTASIQPNPGPLVLFGSGETAPSGRKVFDFLMRRLPPSPRVMLLETPAGFEPNSARVIGRVAEFIEHRLQNYNPQITIIPARQRGTPFSPDDPEIAAPILEADLIFLGPGSPTYAVRQLKNSVVWQNVLARHRLGAALVLASAATVAASLFSLPVYEIYKVGEDPHWKPGLDFFGVYGFPLIFIPHWNNTEGGEELDSSRCFMGQKRFARLMELLPADLTVFGIDEKTALLMEPQEGTCQVFGLGGVTLIHPGHEHDDLSPDLQSSGLEEVARQRAGHVHQFKSGESFKLMECCPFVMPEAGEGLPEKVWEQALEAHSRLEVDTQPAASLEVMALVEARRSARLRKDWAASDALRAQIEDLGWQVLDTAEGPVVAKK